MNAKPSIVTAAIAAVTGVAILCGLGVWQVKRLQWKEVLLAQLAANVAAPPVEVTVVERRMLEKEDVEFTRVSLRGHFEHPSEQKLLAAADKGPGFTIFTPFTLADGRAVLVDRGLVPEQRLGEVGQPQGPLELTGIVRLHNKGPGIFDIRGEHDHRLWYWWNVPQMQSAANLPQATRWFPFVVQILPEAVPAGFPQPVEPKANLANNHLGYAITWFGLALSLAGVAILFIRQQAKKSAA